MQQTEELLQANTKRHYEITKAELPLSCPMADMRLWDAHPRVYLPIEATGRATCPYCEAEYTLVESIKEKTK
jgi:uncharacterized Zn-finger protein